LFHS
jgi:hypothetical protein